jgi:hypothetical protein
MKLCYPQLSTGALAQFPLKRTLGRRTVLNRLPDGSVIRLADPDASWCKWELSYFGLTDAERTSLESFFQETEGRLQSFLFMDPCGNLLCWSEDPTKEVWDADSLLQINAAEGQVILTNTAQTTQSLRQTLQVPGWFHYCFSAFVKSGSASRVRLAIENGDGSIETDAEADTQWRRVFCSGSLGGAAEEISCRLQLEPGAVVEVRGLQMGPQPGVSSAKRTTERNGAFHETRFADDALVFGADGSDNHSTTIRLVSRTRA